MLLGIHEESRPLWAAFFGLIVKDSGLEAMVSQNALRFEGQRPDT